MSKLKSKKPTKEQSLIANLKEQVVDVTRDLRYEKEARIKAEGKVEEFKEEKEKSRRDMVDRNRDLESQVDWMRNLVEFITIPADKLESFYKKKEENFQKMRGY